MEPHSQSPCLPQAGVVPCPTPMCGDISRLASGQAVKRRRIPPRPKAMVSCCRNKQGLFHLSCLLPGFNLSYILVIITKPLSYNLDGGSSNFIHGQVGWICCGEGGNGLQNWSQSRPCNHIYITRKPRPVPAPS